MLPLASDIVRPKVIQTLFTIPPIKKVDDVFLVLDTHRVPTAFGRGISVVTSVVEPCPYGTWLAGAEVPVEKACL